MRERVCYNTLEDSFKYKAWVIFKVRVFFIIRIYA